MTTEQKIIRAKVGLLELASLALSETILTNSAEVRTRNVASCPAADRSILCRRDQVILR